MILLAILSALIGILLGLLGGGGSILMVPVLVYVGGVTAKIAIVTSLIVVGITSLIAMINHARRGFICWKTGASFGSAGMIGAYLGGRTAAYKPDTILLVIFASVMMTASVAMIRGGNANISAQADSETICPTTYLPVLAILFDGVLIGYITGLIGVGGGFLLVPALNFLAGLPMHAAIGTSLFIIVLQSAAALVGHAGHMSVNISLTVLFTSFAIVGSILDSLASAKINSLYLKKGFGIFALCLGVFLLYREMTLETLEQILNLLARHKDFLKGAFSVISLLLIYRLWIWLHVHRNSHQS